MKKNHKRTKILSIIVILSIIGGLFSIFASFLLITKNSNTSEKQADSPRQNILPNQNLYTSHEVASHNTEDKCWIIVGNKVYDITPFLPVHEGGGLGIYCGSDITTEFNGEYHPKEAREILDKYYIGDLKK